jgi:DNA-binding response OmpR family regulator
MRILIVEDEEKLAHLISRGLKAEGFAVDTVNNGKEAIALSSSFSYDLIILDIMLPYLNGTAVLQHIRKGIHQPKVLMLRQPIYRESVERWRHYEKHIAPLSAILQQAEGLL